MPLKRFNGENQETLNDRERKRYLANVVRRVKLKQTHTKVNNNSSFLSLQVDNLSLHPVNDKFK